MNKETPVEVLVDLVCLDPYSHTKPRYCWLCGEMEPDHKPRCVWKRAKELVNCDE